MNDWTSGYVTDVAYTYGYYPELNPLRTRLAFLNAGLAYPEIRTACELGFGQGLSVNIHAAAASASWYGTDFNPSQVAFAQELTRVTQADAKLTDDSFADFASRTDLPQFDFIGLHGIWSWISDSNRTALVDFIRRHLRIGGILYLSYNALPGWAHLMPLRNLMVAHTQTFGAPGQGIVHQIEQAIAFTEKFFATNPIYARVNQQAATRLEAIKGQNRHYLAHEYFNSDWAPADFATIAKWLSPAKLGYGCSAHFLDQLDAINLTPDQQALLQTIPDVVFRETIRDYCMNQQFRRDYWIKGPRQLSFPERKALLEEQRVILTTPRANVPLKTKGALGEANLNEPVYNPILDLLGEHKPLSLGQIEHAVGSQNITFGQILEAVMTLVSMGHVHPTQDPAVVSVAKKRTDKLNAHLMHKARQSPDIGCLASPVTAGGVGVNRFHQLFLLGLREGLKQPEAWAGFVWRILSSQNQLIVKDGKTLQTPEEHLAYLEEEARLFSEKQLPILKVLQIA